MTMTVDLVSLLRMERTVGRAEVEAARERIRPHVRRTPVLELGPGAFDLPCRITLKLELVQHTGSFKPRGAFSKILSSDVPGSGVIAASGGNFGLAVAFAAHTLGHRAEIFVPSNSPRVKADRINALGADVTVVEGWYDEALDASGVRAKETGALVMHAYDQPEVVAGQGTLAAELEEQVPDADTVLVAIGGGGLIGGVAGWYEGRTRVVGVEPETSKSMTAALAAGEPVDVEYGGYAADSLGTKRAGKIAFAIVSKHVERVALVSGEAIRDAQRRLWHDVRIFAEPGGAAALAALLSKAYVPEPEEHVIALVCGANGDLGVLSES
jgi:threonine dehydratase